MKNKRMKTRGSRLWLLCLGLIGSLGVMAQVTERQSPPMDIVERHGLSFDHLPGRWDEGIPLGNGIMGTLIWQKGDRLRLSVDRADLWDLRPVKEFDGPDYSYRFVCEAVARKDMKPVYEMIDQRTSKDVAPTKIPAGAIEIPIGGLGEVKDVVLDVHTAICTITWKNGAVGSFFTGAGDRTGHFRLTNLPQPLDVEWVAPAFTPRKGEKPKGNSLARLGYKEGKTIRKPGHIVYRQQAYGDVAYEVDIRWTRPDESTLEGVYRLITTGTAYSEPVQARKAMDDYDTDFRTARREHVEWWTNYWRQCQIHLPDDPMLERQWYLEMYKFGAASRKDAPPICLQAVWTADNGQTPPWRGDFHNDLNTQLSYWPGYSGFTYRPFTLEGNFAFASAVNEMLLQSHTGVIRVFPAVPENWREASFEKLRAMGAFLVSAKMKDGEVQRIEVTAEKGGTLRLFNPFTRQVVEKEMQPGEVFSMDN